MIPSSPSRRSSLPVAGLKRMEVQCQPCQFGSQDHQHSLEPRFAIPSRLSRLVLQVGQGQNPAELSKHMAIWCWLCQFSSQDRPHSLEPMFAIPFHLSRLQFEQGLSQVELQKRKGVLCWPCRFGNQARQRSLEPRFATLSLLSHLILQAECFAYLGTEEERIVVGSMCCGMEVQYWPLWFGYQASQRDLEPNLGTPSLL